MQPTAVSRRFVQDRHPRRAESGQSRDLRRYADVSLDGFTETLTVGGTVDLPAAEETKASPDFVRDVIRVAFDGRVLNMRYLDVAFRDSDNQKIDVKSALTRLGAAPSYDGTSITMDEARTISEGAGR